MHFLRGCSVVALSLLSACVSLPQERSVACEDAKSPPIRPSEDGLTASTRIDILTYNIEGLPGKIRRGRSDPLREIGTYLAELRRAGTAPDIVMFQEVFSRSARNAVLAAGYPSLAPGPSYSHRQPPALDRSLPGRRNVRRGELGIKFASSGILVAGEFPILEYRALPFAQGSCAGFDCLANKGMVFARVAIPGVPGALDLFNTHMNSMRASRVPAPRYHAAHAKQVREITDFMASTGAPGHPRVLGGDLNMRHSEQRFAEFSRLQPLTLVHKYCAERAEQCEVLMSWDGDEPWMDTQDLQLFSPGNAVSILPVRVQAMFDGGAGGPLLSDHEGFRVTYELRWRVDQTVPFACAPANLSFRA